MIYPKPLTTNDLIGVTATSMGIVDTFDKDRFLKAKNNLLKLGFKTIETNNVYTRTQLVSSSGYQRAKELEDLWLNNDVGVIAQLRGGEFLFELLPFLDDKIIKNNSPKWIFGYSDSSLLNFYITTKFHIATINSSNILHFAMEPLHKSLLNVIKCLTENKITQTNFLLYEENHLDKRIEYNLSEKVKYKYLYKEKNITLQGRIIGGCLEAITELLGTKYDYVESFINSYDEKFIWYLDIYNLDPINLYRVLFQMKEANWFKKINGILIGRTMSSKVINNFTYIDCLHKIFDDLNIPVIYDVDIGHIMPQFAIINGSLVTINCNNSKFTLIQEKK